MRIELRQMYQLTKTDFKYHLDGSANLYGYLKMNYKKTMYVIPLTFLSDSNFFQFAEKIDYFCGKSLIKCLKKDL